MEARAAQQPAGLIHSGLFRSKCLKSCIFQTPVPLNSCYTGAPRQLAGDDLVLRLTAGLCQQIAEADGAALVERRWISSPDAGSANHGPSRNGTLAAGPFYDELAGRRAEAQHAHLR